MPVYEYHCKECGRTEDAFRTIAERHDAPKCHGSMQIAIGLSIGFVQKTFDPYVSPATGKVIASHAARKEDFVRSNSRPWEGKAQEVKEAARRKAYAEAKSEAKLTDHVNRVYHQMPDSKRRIMEGR